jgi:predicted nucleotidyltransferase
MRRPGRRGSKAADPLSTILASGALARIVSVFALRPDDTPHVRALLRTAGLTARSLQIELDRLVALGLLRREADGRRTCLRLADDHPAWPPLRQLVRTLADPADLLRLALVGVPDIRAAFVFGSVARGAAHTGSDVDLFVLLADDDAYRSGGAHLAAPPELWRGTGEVSLLLDREIDVVVRTVDAVRHRLVHRTPFYENLLAGPKRWVVGDARTLDAVLAEPDGDAGPLRAVPA